MLVQPRDRRREDRRERRCRFLVLARDQPQQRRQMIGQVVAFSNAGAREILAQDREKRSALRRVAEQVPSDVERAVRIEVECLDVRLLRGGRSAGRVFERGGETVPRVAGGHRAPPWRLSIASSRNGGGTTNRSATVASVVNR